MEPFSPTTPYCADAPIREGGNVSMRGVLLQSPSSPFNRSAARCEKPNVKALCEDAWGGATFALHCAEAPLLQRFLPQSVPNEFARRLSNRVFLV